MGTILVVCFVVLFLHWCFKKKEVIIPYDPAPNWNGGFATDRELKKAGAFKNKSGITVGLSWETGREFFYNQKPGQRKPIVEFGGMGSYKTTAGAGQIPLIFQWDGSMVIFEATCEGALVAAHYRKKYGRVAIINPDDVYAREFKGLDPVRYNPLFRYWLDPRNTITFPTRARKLGCACVIDEETREKYFDNTARGMARTLIMGVCELLPRPNIAMVAKIAHDDPMSFFERMVRECRNPDSRALARRYARIRAEKADVKSINECISGLCTKMDFLMQQSIEESLSYPDITFGGCRQSKQTIIVVTSMEASGALDRYRGFLHECGLAELQSPQFAGDIPTAIVVDEAQQLGRSMPTMLGMSSLRKYNALMSLCFNDFGMLQHIYGKDAAETFINNAGLVQWMSTKDQVGTEMLSKLLGETEVFTENISVSNPVEGRRGSATYNRTMSKQRRRLMEPWEIAQNLGPMDQIVFMDGVARPILCKKLPFFDKKSRLRKLGRRNPFAPK